MRVLWDIHEGTVQDVSARAFESEETADDARVLAAVASQATPLQEPEEHHD